MATRPKRKSAPVKATVTPTQAEAPEETKPEASEEAPVATGSKPEPETSEEAAASDGSNEPARNTKEKPETISVKTVRGKTSHRRSGLNFGPAARSIDLSKLTADQAKAIKDDPFLVVE